MLQQYATRKVGAWGCTVGEATVVMLDSLVYGARISMSQQEWIKSMICDGHSNPKPHV